MTRVALALLACLTASACECGAAPDAPSPPTPTQRPTLTEPTEERPEPGSGEVTLRYAWPDGARGRVAGRRALARSLGDDLACELSYRLEVERAGDETTLHSGQLEVAPIEARLDADIVSCAGVIDVFIPSSVATPSRLVRLADFDGARQDIEAAFEPAVAPSVRGGQAWHMLEPLWTDRRALLRATESKWDWLVAGYVDREMTLGETGELSGSSTTALTAEAISTAGELTAVGRVPCFDGDAPDRCVFIASRTRIADEAAAQIASDLRVRDLTIRMRSTLVAEVDTLLPHFARLVMVRTFTLGEGEAAQELTETDTKTFRFAWERDSIR